MRTLLYFTLKDTATARLAQACLGDLAGSSARVAGPWFVQRDNQPVDGFPAIDAGQTTYREEAAIVGSARSSVRLSSSDTESLSAPEPLPLRVSALSRLAR